MVCLARGLRKNGCEVSALCESKLSSGYCTRWLNHRYVAPSMTSNPEEFREFFYEHLNNHKYDAIIPTADESAEFLSKEKENIEKNYSIKCAIPEFDTYRKASDKHSLMELCQKIGVSHPHTISINQNNIDLAIEYVGFPALIKPDFSAGARGIVKVFSREDILRELPAIINNYGNCTLQQFIKQPEYYFNVMLYRNHDGNITGSTIIKIRRYFPLAGGTSCYSETVMDSKLMDQCVKVLDHLDWKGFADFDVLQDAESGEYKIIEINPRVPSSLQAAFAADVDFAECYVKDLFGGKVSEFDYKIGKEVRWFGLDVMWFLMSPERFTFRPSWFKFFGKNVSYHDGSWSDPMPMIAGCLEGVKKYLNPEFRKAKLKNK